MARKKKKDEVENYFNNVANYQTEAEARAVTPEGVKVFCAFDELVPIGKVVPNPGNPNTHPPKQVALLAAIIKGQGWRKPITVSKRSGFVVTGHGRLEAAQSMQASVVPVEYQEYASEAEEYADLMADNRLAELSEMNTSALADMLQQMDTGEIPLEMSGYTEEDLEDLLNALGGVDDTENNGEDTVPPPKNIPMTHAGDIWHLGQHRLICGDSTKPETLQKLLGDELAQCVNTDPPYGISLDGGGGNGKRQKQQIENNGMIANDELTDDDLLSKLLIPAFKNAVKYSKPDAAFYIYHATDTRRDFEDAMTAAGLLEKQYLIWLKNNHNLSGTDYLRDFEPMFYAEKAGHTAKWCGDRSNNTCWKITLRDDAGMATTLSGGIVVTDGAGGNSFPEHKQQWINSFCIHCRTCKRRRGGPAWRRIILVRRRGQRVCYPDGTGQTWPRHCVVEAGRRGPGRAGQQWRNCSPRKRRNRRAWRRRTGQQYHFTVAGAATGRKQERMERNRPGNVGG